MHVSKEPAHNQGPNSSDLVRICNAKSLPAVRQLGIGLLSVIPLLIVNTVENSSSNSQLSLAFLYMVFIFLSSLQFSPTLLNLPRA